MSWYEDHQAELAEQQANKTRQEVADELKTQAEHVFDPDTVVPLNHNWIQRGIKMSCEGASHPPHQTWLRHSGGAAM